MKKAVVLPIVAAVSGALIGCGGSSGGGGGASQTKYNFTFAVAKTQQLSTNGSCTIYDRHQDDEVDMVLNYHSVGNALDSNLLAFYSDAEGKRSGDLIAASQGKITIVLESIPSGGSVTLQETYGNFFNAVTFSKDALANDTSLKNTIVSAENPVAQTTCLTGNNDGAVTKTNLDYLKASDATGNPYDLFYFQSQYDLVTANDSRFTNGEVLPAVSGEQTMIAQYLSEDRSELYQYGFENWSEKRMVFAGSRATPLNQQSDLIYDQIDISALYNGFSYKLMELTPGQDFNHPDTLNGDSWVFAIDGSIGTAGWTALYTGEVSDSFVLEVNEGTLFQTTNTSDVKPSVYGNKVDVTGSIGITSENGVQRFTYEQSTTSGSRAYYAHHSIYSQIAPELIVPELYVPAAVQEGLKVNDSSNMTQAYAFTESEADVSLSEFMTYFSHGDGSSTERDILGVVKNEKEMRLIENHISQTHLLLLERND